MNFTVLRRPRTQALLDGTVKSAGLTARWLATSEPLGWDLPPSERHRDLSSSEIDGGEMSISSFLQAKSRGAPLLALPIFLKRGLVQRSLFCPMGSPLSFPEQLVGKKVGLVSYASSMSVWVRGILSDGYGVASSTVDWFIVGGSSDKAQSLSIPDTFTTEPIQAWEELDGYAHQLDRREGFLLSLLDQGQLDAVVSFQARIDCAKSRPLVRKQSLWSHPINSKIYPINHLFVLKKELLHASPTIAESLVTLFRKARDLSTSYQPVSEQGAFETETARLGYDPFAYRLGEVEKSTLKTFIGYLQREKLVSRHLELEELFHLGI